MKNQNGHVIGGTKEDIYITSFRRSDGHNPIDVLFYKKSEIDTAELAYKEVVEEFNKKYNEEVTMKMSFELVDRTTRINRYDLSLMEIQRCINNLYV